MKNYIDNDANDPQFAIPSSYNFDSKENFPETIMQLTSLLYDLATCVTMCYSTYMNTSTVIAMV